MRFVLGFLVGAIFVIGAAYIHDASLDSAKDPIARPMVNWEVVSENMRGLNGWLHEQWGWLNEKLRPAR